MFKCPHCDREIPLTAIPDADFASERGRRHSVKRRLKPVGPIIWKRHNPAAKTPPCRCADCLIARQLRIERLLIGAIRRHYRLVDAPPLWEKKRVSSTLRDRQKLEALLASQGLSMPPLEAPLDGYSHLVL